MKILQHLKKKAKSKGEASGSSEGPERTHEPKGPPGRPRSVHVDRLSIPDEPEAPKPKPRARTRSPAKRTHGVDKDKSISRSHWQRQNVGYLKTQLELLGERFEHWQFTGARKPVLDEVTGKQKVDPVTGEKLFTSATKEEKMTKKRNY